MLSVNVCQMVQDAGLYGVMTTGLKCHQARCNQSVGHSSTIWDLSLSALSEPVLNLGHGLRGVSAKPGKRTAARCFPCYNFSLIGSVLQCAVRGKPRPVLPGHVCAGGGRTPFLPFGRGSGFAPTTCKDEQRGLRRQEASGTRRALGPAPRGRRSRSSSAGNVAATGTNPPPCNAISAGLSGRPRGIWDINQVLIRSALVKVLSCAREGRTEPRGHRGAGTELPAPAEPSRAPCHLLGQAAGSLLLPCARESLLCVTKSGVFTCVHLPSVFFQRLQLKSLTNPTSLFFPPPVKYSPICHCTWVNRDGAQKPSQRPIAERQGRRLHPDQVLKKPSCIILFILTCTNIYPFFPPLRKGETS